MKILLIVNPAASSVTSRLRVLIHKAISAEHDVTLTETTRRGHADRLARAAANAGTDVVVILGGDGTLNEVANGLIDTDTALAVLPGGSTNVFARIIGVPDDPIEATSWLLDALRRQAVTSIGLGAVQGRYFLFHCGIGFDAAVVEQVERKDPWKRWAGHPLFMYTAIRMWIRYNNHVRTQISVLNTNGRALAENNTSKALAENDNGTTLAEGKFVVVMNANPYTFLGNRSLGMVPDMTLNTPLAVVVLPTLAMRSLIPVIARALRTGDLQSMEGVIVHTGLRDITCTTVNPTPYQLDGDYVGDTTQMRLQWFPDKLKIVGRQVRHVHQTSQIASLT